MPGPRRLRNIELFDLHGDLQRLWGGLRMFREVVDGCYRDPKQLVQQACARDRQQVSASKLASAAGCCQLMHTVSAALLFYAPARLDDDHVAPAFWPDGELVDRWQHRNAWARLLFCLQMQVCIL